MRQNTLGAGVKKGFSAAMAETTALVIDADEVGRRHYEGLLGSIRCRAFGALSLRAALHQTLPAAPELILVDAAAIATEGMPALSALRERHPGAEVLVSAGADALDCARQAVVECDTVGYLVKPFLDQELLRAAKNVLIKIDLLHEIRALNVQLRSQQALAASDAGLAAAADGFFKELVDASPQIICEVDLYGQIVYVNRRFEQVTSYTLDELKGRRWQDIDLLPDMATSLMQQRTQEKLDGKPARPLRVTIRHKDGHLLEVCGIGNFRMRDGKPAGAYIYADLCNDGQPPFA
jgi:PAS domain S-box-containing protein